MRNEQEFKALVMQKVRVQQHQKQQRLQKIRAATATMSAVALVICGVATVTLFIRSNPTVDFGAQDGPYGGNKGNWFFSLFYRGSVDEEDSGWGNSAAIGDSDSSHNTDTGEGNTDSGSDDNTPEAVVGESVDSSIGGTTSDSPQSTDKNSSGAEGLPNCDSSVQNDSAGSSEGYLPNSDAPGSDNTESDAPEESVKACLYLEEIHTEKAAFLKLSGGRIEDPDAITPIVGELESILTEASATEKTGDAVLFALRFENGYAGGTYRFCEGNIMTLTINDKTESYLVKSTDYLRLLRLLQQTEFTIE